MLELQFRTRFTAKTSSPHTPSTFSWLTNGSLRFAAAHAACDARNVTSLASTSAIAQADRHSPGNFDGESSLTPRWSRPSGFLIRTSDTVRPMDTSEHFALHYSFLSGNIRDEFMLHPSQFGAKPKPKLYRQ